jgi:hypothetical protein
VDDETPLFQDAPPRSWSEVDAPCNELPRARDPWLREGLWIVIRHDDDDAIGIVDVPNPGLVN